MGEHGESPEDYDEWGNYIGEVKHCPQCDAQSWDFEYAGGTEIPVCTECGFWDAEDAFG